MATHGDHLDEGVATGSLEGPGHHRTCPNDRWGKTALRNDTGGEVVTAGISDLPPAPRAGIFGPQMRRQNGVSDFATSVRIGVKASLQG